jgi:hypothetical protein
MHVVSLNSDGACRNKNKKIKKKPGVILSPRSYHKFRTVFNLYNRYDTIKLGDEISASRHRYAYCVITS